MADLFDYLAWRDDLDLRVSPFNEVDGVILARMAYFPYELVGMTRESVMTVGAAAGAFLSTPGIRDKLLLKADYELIGRLAMGARYHEMELFGYRNVLDTAAQIQFAAITVRLDEGRYYVSFRGTDDSLVGWKEDLNMAFESPVPAQLLAARYLDDIAAARPEGRFILGGHSKGGNLAVYAGAFCTDETRARVETVYNFDGPGFDEGIMDTDEYRAICAQVHTYVPQSSVVGMLLEHEEEYTIVHSDETGLMQHNVFSWSVGRSGFVYLERVTDGSRFVDSTVKDWIAGMDYEKREAFVEAVYTVLNETNASTLHELGENRISSALAMLRSLRDMDEPTRKLVSESVTSLIRSARGELARTVQGALQRQGLTRGRDRRTP